MAESVLEPFACIVLMWLIWAALRVGVTVSVLLWELFKT